MSFFSTLGAAFGIESKAATEVITTQVIDLPTRSNSEVLSDLRRESGTGGFSAIQIATVFACARVIAEGLAAIPCSLQRRTATGGHEHAYDHPLYRLLSRQPNSWQTSLEFREWIGLKLALTGNAYVFVARDTKGRAIELTPLADGAVSVSTDSAGEPVYRLNVAGNPVYSRRSIWHLKGASLDGVSGLNPQVVAARSIGLMADI